MALRPILYLRQLTFLCDSLGFFASEPRQDLLHAYGCGPECLSACIDDANNNGTNKRSIKKENVLREENQYHLKSFLAFFHLRREEKERSKWAHNDDDDDDTIVFESHKHIA